MTLRSNLEVEYGVLDPEKIDLIRPLWEKLNAHHARISSYFSEDLRVRRFQDRKSQLLRESKKLHFLLVTVPSNGSAVAYCIASLTPAGEGEIDSMFVDEEYRGSGIGTKLMQRALAWLDDCGATSKSVVALFENAAALGFYAHFGFYPRNISLSQKKLATQENPISVPRFILRELTTEEVDDGYEVYLRTFDWLNRKGIRQWLAPLPKVVYAQKAAARTELRPFQRRHAGGDFISHSRASVSLGKKNWAKKNCGG